MKKTKKLQKPIDTDLHLKYRCKKCGLDHWLSYREAATKNFKVVCMCGLTFKVRRVIGLKLQYEPYEQIVEEKPQVIKEEISTPTPPGITPEICATENVAPVQKNIPSELLEKAVKLLLGYGFTKTEATKMVTNTYFRVPVDDYATLVKYTLESIGDNNEIINSSSI